MYTEERENRGYMIAVIICFVLTAALVLLDVYAFRYAYKSVEKAAYMSKKEVENDALYTVNTELMSLGAYDDREFYTIEDEEYMNWRITNQPIKGRFKDVSVPIKVRKSDISVSDDDFNYIVECISWIPENFVKKMDSDGWTVIVTRSDNMSSKYADANETVEVMGQTDFLKKTITVRTDADPWVIYHEIGHVVASYAEDDLMEAGLDRYQENGELSKLCCHSAYGSPYIYGVADEQLAESLYDFIWYPREMQEQAPTLYEIYSKTING